MIPTARDTDSRSSPRNRRITTSRLRPAENRPPRPRPAATPVATDSSTCCLISTLLLRELSRNQVSKKTLGRRRTKLLSVSNTAQRLGKSEDTILRWADSGRLECIRLADGTRLFRSTDIDALLGQRRQCTGLDG